MKTILTVLASCALFTSVASAHPGCETSRRVVGYTRCGDPIIATLEIVGYARCGDPIREWVTHSPEHVVLEGRHHDHDRDDFRGRDHDRDRDDHHHHWH